MPEITNEVLAERLCNLDSNNKEAHQAIKTQIEAFVVENRLLVDHIEGRVKTLEFWKVGFVAKFSVYTAVALFTGSMIAQLLIKYLSKFI